MKEMKNLVAKEIIGRKKKKRKENNKILFHITQMIIKHICLPNI